MHWYHTDTGGGCSAERREFPDGSGYALLTDEENEAQAPHAHTIRFVVGIYTADDAYLGCEIGTRGACYAWLEERLASRFRSSEQDAGAEPFTLVEMSSAENREHAHTFCAWLLSAKVGSVWGDMHGATVERVK